MPDFRESLNALLTPLLASRGLTVHDVLSVTVDPWEIAVEYYVRDLGGRIQALPDFHGPHTAISYLSYPRESQ